ncbi:hypothetical protein Scep_008006 [Stephania cephalantha]|uniref:Uncharacterized protein n=1 Tax=Stephania cephalantha TaxID=152367 RepID=A0AAP0KCQ7_9MAGN
MSIRWNANLLGEGENERNWALTWDLLWGNRRNAVESAMIREWGVIGGMEWEVLQGFWGIKVSGLHVFVGKLVEVPTLDTVFGTPTKMRRRYSSRYAFEVPIQDAYKMDHEYPRRGREWTKLGLQLGTDMGNRRNAVESAMIREWDVTEMVEVGGFAWNWGDEGLWSTRE